MQCCTHSQIGKDVCVGRFIGLEPVSPKDCKMLEDKSYAEFVLLCKLSTRKVFKKSFFVLANKCMPECWLLRKLFPRTPVSEVQGQHLVVNSSLYCMRTTLKIFNCLSFFFLMKKAVH